MNYQDADSQLTGRNHDSRKLANNTYLMRRDGDDIAIKLHDTDVVTFHADGTLTLNSGGWLTMTTKDRMRYADSVSISSDGGRWFFHFPAGMDRFPYFDGITLDPKTRTVVNPESAPDVAAEDKANDATRKKVRAYVALYTDERIRALVKDASEHGAAGDCWFCLGMNPDSTDHLLGHLEEGYTMVSLARNALADKGYRDPVYVLHYGSGRMVRDAIGRYLRKRLLIGSVVTR